MSAGRLADWIAPARTALIIVDMQVDFALPEGAMGQSGADLSAVPAALAAAGRLALSARQAGADVFFVGLQSDPGPDSPFQREWMRRRGENTPLAPLCLVDTHGAAFVGPTPVAGEKVVAKRRYSGFFNTDLNEALKDSGADTLVVCGLTTECCVDCTVRDAFHLDFHVFVAADACAAYDAGLHAAALKSLALSFATLTTTDEVLAAWRGQH